MQLRPHSIRILSCCGSRASSGFAALSLLLTTVSRGTTEALREALGSAVHQAIYNVDVGWDQRVANKDVPRAEPSFLRTVSDKTPMSEIIRH